MTQNIGRGTLGVQRDGEISKDLRLNSFDGTYGVAFFNGVLGVSEKEIGARRLQYFVLDTLVGFGVMHATNQRHRWLFSQRRRLKDMRDILWRVLEAFKVRS